MPKTPKDPKPAYLDTSLPLEARVDDLVSRLAPEEKIGQTLTSAPAIERLGIPGYDWWNECLHGVGRAGIATVFPQAIGLAATWNVELMHRVATAISDEARAKHHEFVRQGVRERYTGLTFFSPNINIFRDPRWGRGHETFGEDPLLTSRMGVAFIRGLQGDDPRYLKLVATAKHYAVHSGPESERHGFNAVIDQRDLQETYLPAFKAVVQEGHAASVMGAYNRVNGEPCCASQTLLIDVLRKAWGFDGYVVSDCGALDDIYRHHKLVGTPEEAAALALSNGCDLNCGDTFRALGRAVEQGLISEGKIDEALKRLFRARFKLGMFDPPEMVPYAQIPYGVNDCAEHRQLALEAAKHSLVLLKNADGRLPLSKSLRTIAVIGPDADDHEVLLGNYNGTPSHDVTALDGIRNKLPKAQVLYAKGCDITSSSTQGFAEAVAIAQKAEVAIMVMGLHPRVEGEEGDAPDSAAGGDRTRLDLPGVQEDLLKAIHATGRPVVLVLMGGSALSVNWADEHIPAILLAWYPGEEGGAAIADALFGDHNPAGRLPVTFYRSLEQVPPFDDYRMAHRTYRYLRQAPLYPFGYGLSYTEFKYSNLTLSSREIRPDQQIEIAVDIENAGERAGDEVVQLYLSDVAAAVPVPGKRLCGFQRVHLGPGAKQSVRFALSPAQLSVIDAEGKRIIEPGPFLVSAGGGQPGARGANVLTETFEVAGAVTRLD
jgi:beta-glucosidase